MDDRPCRRRIRGGQVYGSTDLNGHDVSTNPVSEGGLVRDDLHRPRRQPAGPHYVGARPIWATPEGSRPIRELLS